MNGQSDLVCQVCLKLGIEVAVESEATHIELHLNAEFDNSTNVSQVQMHSLCFPVQESKVICDDCDMEFSSKSVLEDHMVTEHSKSKPNIVVPSKSRSHLCGFCEKSFKWESHRVRHENAVHKKLKEFSCNICGKKFSGQSYRIRHKRIVHSNEKNFSCRICHKTFKWNNTRLRHQKDFHSQSHPLIQHKKEVHKKPKELSCRICHKEFNDSSTLRRHEKTIHLKEKRFSCEICPRKFDRNSNRIRHAKTIHSQSHPTGSFLSK